MVSTMSEPHQRSRSGKLGKPTKQNKLSQSSNQTYIDDQSNPGIENASVLTPADDETELEQYCQTPTTLTGLHISILQELQIGYGALDNQGINDEWRRTWNIGAWTIKDKMCISANIMQPNIANCWVDIKDIDISIVQKYADKLLAFGLPKSTCKVTGINSIKVQGRWSLTLAQMLLDDNLIGRDKLQVSNLNICNSRIFFWIILATGSEYLCTLTLTSVELLSRYLPDYCYCISEVNSANNTSIRIKNPTVANDASQLTINKAGFIQYNGKSQNMKRLSEGLSISIHRIIKSPFLKSFLQSLEYKKSSVGK